MTMIRLRATGPRTGFDSLLADLHGMEGVERAEELRPLVGDPPHQSAPQTGSRDLKGQIFNDTNSNGRLDPGETPLAGRFVFLDYNNNGTRDPGEAVTATTRAGWYVFKGLTAGSFRVRHVIGRFEQVESTSQEWRIARLPTNAIFNFGLRIL